MPDLNGLVGRRVAVVWSDKEDKEVVLNWYFGEVTKVTKKKRSKKGVVVKCMAAIKWESGGTTTPQELSEDAYAGADNTLGVNSWMQA